MMRCALALVFVGLTLGGCGDQGTEPPPPGTGPCDRAGACEVAGVDLLIDSVWIEQLGTDDSLYLDSGLPVLQNFDSVLVGFVVRNRGDEPSLPTRAHASPGAIVSASGFPAGFVQIPGLGPGEITEKRLWLPLDSHMNQRTLTPVVRLGVGPAVDEPFHRNDQRQARDSFFVAGPWIGGEVTVLSGEVRFGTPLEVRAGTQLEVASRLVNQSGYGILRDTSASVCFKRLVKRACSEPAPVPELGPQDEYRDTVSVTAPLAFDDQWHRAIEGVGLAVCVTQPSDANSLCSHDTWVTLLPDVERACDIVRLSPGAPSSGNSLCYTSFTTSHYIWSFEALAGRTYTVEVSGELAGETRVSIWDRDGRQHGTADYGVASVAIPTAGRYYVVLEHDDPSAEYVVMLTDTSP